MTEFITLSEKECEKISKAVERQMERMIAKAEGRVNLLTQSQRQKLLKNFWENDAIIQKDGMAIDFKPVVKLFMSDCPFVWLLSELSPDGIAYGLADLGQGFPEIGYINLKELETLKGKLGLPVERDRSFVADKTLCQYSNLARREQKIVA